ncbi:MAG: AraC family transcriptional regulator [Eubacteriales bacterium]|nr:AraC family transcriptional regulator [Eubacteriales bacterium]
MDKYILDGQYGKYLNMIGIRIGEALKAAGVPEDLFSRKKPVLAEADYYRFMDAVGAQITDPRLPIMIASADHIESFSPPIFASYCSKNGRTCLERLARHKRIIAPMRYEITDSEETVRLEISASREDLAMPQFLAETEMVFVIHIMRTATKANIVPIEVVMQDPVTDAAFTDFLGCNVKKGESNALVFHKEDMEKPFISYNENMWEFFEPELKKRLYEMERDESFSAKVRSALTELLPGGAGTVEEVAEKLGVSKRTLQRKLTEENTTFQKQLNGTRELLAKHYLRNTDMSSDDIAFLLGYQEINSFLRAFSIWTGMSVSEYRKTEG